MVYFWTNMVGQFNRDNLILKAKNNKYYNKHEFFKPSGQQSYYHNAESIVNDVGDVGTAFSVGSGVLNKGASILNNSGRLANGASEIATTVGDVASTVGKVAGGVGIVTSGVGLGFNIADAVKEKKNDGKVSFNTAMNIADNATGVVAGAASFIPVVGTGLSIGLNVGEKIITSAIKAGKAVSDEKKKEGVKHLSPGQWLETSTEAIFPHWMTTDFKTLSEEHKAKKQADKAEVQRETEIMRQSITNGKNRLKGSRATPDAIIANKMHNTKANHQKAKNKLRYRRR
jgi:hypothetical protein